MLLKLAIEAEHTKAGQDMQPWFNFWWTSNRLVTWSVRRGLVATLTETVEKACALVCQPKDFVCGNDLVSPAHTATDPLGRSSWFFSCRKQLDLQVRRWATKQCQQTTVCMSGML